MASNPRLPPKKDVALALLEQSTVFVHLDPRDDSVRVPPWFKKQPQLVLQIGLNMAIPIPDLDVSDEAVSCTLSFQRAPHFCWIPWKAIFALVGENGRGMVWPDDVPSEVAAQAGQQRKEEKPKLRAVPPKVEAAPVAAKAKKKRARKAAARSAKDVTPKEEAKPARAGRTAARAAAAPPAPVAAPARVSTESSSTGATAGGDKPRRALPPYLRVIK